MRRQENALLQAPYANATSGEGPDQLFRERLGVRIRAVHELEKEILSDLHPDIFGVHWWSGNVALGDKRRILISDYLCQAAESIEPNVVEAKLHLFELLDCWERQDRLMADAIVPDLATGGVRLAPPRHGSAEDHLPDVLATLHIAGFMRAINSAHDCLGAVLIGVAALPRPIVKTHLQDALTSLRSHQLGLDAERKEIGTLQTSIQDVVVRAGPNGWLEWVAKYRHMLVHRGRRMSGGEVVPRERDPDRALAGPDGRPLMRARVIPLLAREPAWSEVDVFRSREPQWLGEHAEHTLRGILESTMTFLGDTAAILADLWRRRRADPQLLVQPAAQWPKTDLPKRIGFAGYDAARGISPDTATVSESTIIRLKAAALETKDAKKWATFT